MNKETRLNLVHDVLRVPKSGALEFLYDVLRVLKSRAPELMKDADVEPARHGPGGILYMPGFAFFAADLTCFGDDAYGGDDYSQSVSEAADQVIALMEQQEPAPKLEEPTLEAATEIKTKLHFLEDVLTVLKSKAPELMKDAKVEPALGGVVSILYVPGFSFFASDFAYFNNGVYAGGDYLQSVSSAANQAIRIVSIQKLNRKLKEPLEESTEESPEESLEEFLEIKMDATVMALNPKEAALRKRSNERTLDDWMALAGVTEGDLD